MGVVKCAKCLLLLCE